MSEAYRHRKYPAVFQLTGFYVAVHPAAHLVTLIKLHDEMRQAAVFCFCLGVLWLKKQRFEKTFDFSIFLGWINVFIPFLFFWEPLRFTCVTPFAWMIKDFSIQGQACQVQRQTTNQEQNRKLQAETRALCLTPLNLLLKRQEVKGSQRQKVYRRRRLSSPQWCCVADVRGGAVDRGWDMFIANKTSFNRHQAEKVRGKRNISSSWC